MQHINTATMFAYLAGRMAARRDAAMEQARMRPETKTTSVMLARSFNRSMVSHIKDARRYA